MLPLNIIQAMISYIYICISVNIRGDAACAVIMAESEAKRIDKSVTQSA